jgi:Tol biopolymer transport system component
MDSNGTNVRQLTVLNATSRTPKFLPNGNGLIIFSSNYGGEQQQSSSSLTNRPFSLYIVNRHKGNTVKKVGLVYMIILIAVLNGMPTFAYFMAKADCLPKLIKQIIEMWNFEKLLQV